MAPSTVATNKYRAERRLTQATASHNFCANRVGRAISCYPALMSLFVRYMGVVLLVLVFAVVFTICGEGACETCIHSCCEKSDRVDRLRTVVGRVLAACGVCRADAGIVSAWAQTRLQALASHIAPSPAQALANGVSPLRI